MTITTKFDTHEKKLGKTSTPTGNGTMIGNFTVKAYADKEHKKVISTKNPITVGESIYTKITASDLPAGLTYQVLNCDIQNTGHANWKKNSEFIKLWQNQTCLNNDIKQVGINAGKLDKTNAYAFDFKAFTFDANTLNQNTMTMVSFSA